MSMLQLQKAFGIIENNSGQADFEGAKEEELISLAESALGVVFPPTYMEFLSKYGCVDIAGCEFYGLVNGDFEGSGIPDAIWLTLEERKNSDLPDNLVIVYALGDGSYHALDCSVIDQAGECPVVEWIPGSSKSGQALEIIAQDYGQFLLEKIESAIY